VAQRPAQSFPFSALVGQDSLKLALLLNAVDPRVGGVLIRGEKGTAKSTAVRALADVLPEIDVVEECRFSCNPADPASWCVECRERRDKGALPKSTRVPKLVELPVSATEDRLVGTLDLEHALKHGQRRFQPGLLAEANRGILYVDEVNLLDDHLVDTLLDAAAMAVNTVEREGVSFSHPARFILVGTMNPEEGDVRPQLLDRFGLCVEIEGIRDPEQRVEILKRRRAFEEDAIDFARGWVDAEDELKMRLKHARLRTTSMDVDEELLFSVARFCSSLGVDGHRADLTMVRAASALAALEGRSEVTSEDVRRVAPLVLVHRLRREPFDDVLIASERLVSAVSQSFGEDGADDPGAAPASADCGDGDGKDVASATSIRGDDVADELDSTVSPIVPDLETQLDRMRRTMSGRRQQTISADGRGRYVRAEQNRGQSTDVALDATVRAAAPNQASRDSNLAIAVKPEEVMTKVRKRRVGATIVLCVDGSGSMGADSRMDAAKVAILDLLVDAYQRRDRVGLVSFRGDRADVVLAPTASVELAQLKLKSLPTGGATPLAAGLLRALELLESEVKRNSDVVPWLVLVTDGRANVGLNGGLGSEDARAVATRLRSSGVKAVVVDTGSGPRAVSMAREIADVADAEYVRLVTLDGASIAATVRDRVSGVGL